MQSKNTAGDGRDRGCGGHLRPLVRVVAVAGLLATGLSGLPAHAGNTWDGGGGDNNWGTGDNWDPNGTPGYGTITFAGSARTVNTNNSAVASQNQIAFNSTSPFTLRGSGLNLFDNGGTQAKIENLSSGKGTIDLSITFAATTGTALGEINPISGDLEFNGTVTVSGSAVNALHVYGSNARTLRFNNVISGSGKAFMLKQNNVVIFNGANTYTGNTEIDIGEIWIDTDGDIASGSSIYVGNGALPANTSKFFISKSDGGKTFSRALNINGGNGALENRELGGLNTSGVNTFSGNIVRATGADNRTLTLYAADGGTVDFTGVIDGDDRVVKRAAGTVRLGGANTYSANTEIDAGALHIREAGSLSGGTVFVGNGTTPGTSATFLIADVDGGTIVARPMQINPGNGALGNRTVGGNNTSGVNTYSGTLSRDSDGDNEAVTLTAASGGTVDFTGALAGDDAVWVTGGGVIRFSTTAKTYTGATIVTNASTLSLNAANLIDDSSDIIIATGSTFDLNGNSETIDALSGSGGVITNASVTAATLTVGSAGGGGTYAGRIVSATGSIALTKTGAGTLVLSGDNAYPGTTTINGGGTLTLSGNNTTSGNTTISASSTLNINSATALGTGTLIINGTTTLNNSSGGAITLSNNNPLTLSNGSFTFTGSNDLNFGTGAVTLSGDNRTITVSAGTLTLGGAIGESGTRKLTKAGGGTLVLSGAGTYTGGFEVSGGTAAIGTDTTPGSGTLTLSGGTLQSIGGARSLPNVTVVTASSGIGGAADFTFNASGTFTFSGGSRTLTVSNSGLTTLAGNVFLSDNNSTGGRTQTFVGSGNVTITAPVANNNVGNTVAVNLAYGGSGTLTLAASSSHSGETRIDSGTLALGAGGGFTATSKVYLGNGGNSTNATLALAANGVDLTRDVQVNVSAGSGTRTIASTAASGATTLSGNVDVNRDVSLTATAGSTLTISGNLKLNNSGENDATISGNVTLAGTIDVTSGASEVNYTGGGTLTISGNNSGEPYKLNVAGGTVFLNHANALGSAYGDKVNFATAASTLRVGATMAPASLGMTVAAVNPTIQVDPAVIFTVPGAVDATAGSPVVSKTGTGTLRLTGTASANDVGVAVNAGTFGGAGIAGTLAVNANGRIAPGSSPGTMAAGDTTWDEDGGYTWEINDFSGAYGSDPGWDRLDVTGTLTIDATSGNPFTIHITSLNGASPGDAANFSNASTYTRKIATASGGITGFAAGTFVVDDSGFSNAMGGGAWSVQQTGNDIELVFTPAGAGPNLTAGPDLNFSVMLGSAPTEQTFGVTNTGSGTLTYTNTVTYGVGASGWATIAPVTGALNVAQFATHTVGVSVVGLTGTFWATNTITGNQTNGNQTVALSLTVTNVPPPTAATATADGEELVRLAWTRATGLGTLILGKTSAIVTDPTPGTPYAVGSTLDGATVLYNGSAASLEHVVGPGLTNHYRLYAVNNDYYSADPVGASVTSGVFRSGELVEPFAYTSGVAIAGLNGGAGWGGSSWTAGAQGTKLVETNYNATDVPYFRHVPNTPTNTGNRLALGNPGNGSTNVVARAFPAISTGRVYAAAMLAYQYQGANKWCGLSLLSGGTEKLFAGKIPDGSDRSLGLSGVGGMVVSSPLYEIWPFAAPGSTSRVYIVILRYDFDTREVATKAYDLNQTVPRLEPAAWDATDTLGPGDVVDLDGVRLHAGSVDPGNTIGRSYFDGVRVATNWLDLLNDDDPLLAAAPLALTFNANLGQNPSPATQPYSVSNLNGGLLTFTGTVTYASGSGWLAIEPDNEGALAAGAGIVHTARVTSLRQLRGTHEATNRLDGGSAGVVDVVVTLNVTGTVGQVVYDAFEYTGGSALSGNNGGTGWGGAWAANSATSPVPYVAGAGLASFDYYCNDGGNAAAVDMANCGEALEAPCADLYREGYREFADITDGVVYLGFKLRAQNMGNGRDFGVMLGDGGDWKLKVGKVSASANTLGIQSANGTSLSAYTLNAGNDYLVILRHDMATGESRMQGYVANNLSTNESWEATTHTAPAGAGPFNRVTLFARNGLAGETAGVVTWDDVRVATTWGDLLCGFGIPQGYPVVSNVTFHAADVSNRVTDAAIASGNFPISMTFYDEYRVVSDNENSPYFKPNFDILNANGDAIATDAPFSATTYSGGGAVMVGSNATLPSVASVYIPGAGELTLRWSAINSNGAYRINNPHRADGSNITVTVYDDDREGPAPRLLYVGPSYSPGLMATNITDADITDGFNLVDLAVEWTDPSGVFMTNSPPHANQNIFDVNGRVVPNWDLVSSNRITHEVINFGFDQVFSNFYGMNGHVVVTTAYVNAFALTNLNFNNDYYLTVSGEDEDNDRGTYGDPEADGDDIPWDRAIITNAVLSFTVMDDDADPPTFNDFTVQGNSRGTNIVTGLELSLGGWSVTGIVQDAYSGVRVNGTSTNEPDNSPFLRLIDPQGAIRLTEILTNGISNGVTDPFPVNVSTPVIGWIPSGVWTAMVVVTDIDDDRVFDHASGTNVLYFAVPTFEWDAGAGADRDWTNAINWTVDTLPAASDTAHVNGGHTAVVSQVGERVGALYVGDNGVNGEFPGTGTVEQVSGSLGVNDTLVLGENLGDLGRYAISGGSLTVTGLTVVGSAGAGMLTVTGTADVVAINHLVVGGGGGPSDTGSVLEIMEGSVSARQQLRLGGGAGGHGALEMSGGVLAVSNVFSIGHAAGATGVATVVGGRVEAGGPAAGQHLVVGASGSGTLTLSGTATVLVQNARNLLVGNAAGAVGSATVEGGELVLQGGNVRIGEASGSTGAMTVTGGFVSAVTNVIGSAGLGTLTVSGGAVTGTFWRVSDETTAAGSALNVAGGRVVSLGGFEIEHSGALNVSGGSVNIPGILNLGYRPNARAEFNLSGGVVVVSNDVNISSSIGTIRGATGVVHQTGGTLVITNASRLAIGAQGTAGEKYGFYTITNGAIVIHAGSNAGDLKIGDAESTNSRGVFHLVGASPSVSVGDDFVMATNQTGELQVTLRESALATIGVRRNIQLAGTLTVSNIGTVVAGEYMFLSNAVGTISGTFSATNWAGTVTGRVVTAANRVSLLFGPMAEVRGTNTALVIANGDPTADTADGSGFGDVEADTAREHVFTIRNANATFPLSLTNVPAVVVSGDAAFTVVSQPATSNLAPLTGTPFTLRFAPPVVGAYTATVTIASDDRYANPYTFQVSGQGVLAAEPTRPASNLTFSAVSNFQMRVSWQNGDGANRLLVAKAVSGFGDTPADATVYGADAVFGNGATIGADVFAVFNGAGTNAMVTGLLPGVTYHFALFEYNGSNGGINYRQTAPLTGSQTTLTFPPIIAEGVSVVVTMSENGTPTPFSLTLNASDADMPYDTISWSLLSAPPYGSATAAGTGASVAVGFVPALYFAGQQSFRVAATDSFGNYDEITVHVNVLPVNAPGKVIYIFE